MTKDEFVSLQLLHQQSGKSLKRFLKEAGICYSRYHYWDKKLLVSAKNRNVRNNVSAVPINRYCGFIFQKVSPLFSQRASVLVVTPPILPVFSTSPSRDIQSKFLYRHVHVVCQERNKFYACLLDVSICYNASIVNDILSILHLLSEYHLLYPILHKSVR